MADRINGMRAQLKDLLVKDLGSKLNWDHITNQIGMCVVQSISHRSWLTEFCLAQVRILRHHT